jgi:hypothetical protein
MEATIGFHVDTTFGSGKVTGYTNGGKTFQQGQYLIQVNPPGRVHSISMTVQRKDVMECKGTMFFPVVEQIKEAAKYKLQVDIYKAEMMQRVLADESQLIQKSWRIFSEGLLFVFHITQQNI